MVSPLRRAIQTANELFRDHPNRPKFVAEPMLREMILSSCDIGARLEETMKEFPFINYDRLMENPFVRQVLRKFEPSTLIYGHWSRYTRKRRRRRYESS